MIFSIFRLDAFCVHHTTTPFTHACQPTKLTPRQHACMLLCALPWLVFTSFISSPLATYACSPHACSSVHARCLTALLPVCWLGHGSTTIQEAEAGCSSNDCKIVEGANFCFHGTRQVAEGQVWHLGRTKRNSGESPHIKAVLCTWWAQAHVLCCWLSSSIF